MKVKQSNKRQTNYSFKKVQKVYYKKHKLPILNQPLQIKMLQKKRDEFRKQIRRQQLDKYRQQKRKALLQQYLNNDIFNQLNQIWSNIQLCLNSIAQKNYQMARESMSHQMELNGLKNEHKQDHQNISTLVNYFHQLKSISPYDYEQIFTKYMMNKQTADRVLKILNDVVQNEWSLDEEDNQWLLDSEVKKYPSVIRAKVIYEMIKFLDTLGLMVIGNEVIREIIDSLWKILTDASHFLFSQADNYDLLRYTLSILTKMLEDNKNPHAYHYMQQKGLGSQLVKFIDRIRKLPVSLQTHSALLHLIDNYLNMEMTLSSTKVSEKVGQITLQTSKVNEKQILLVYCIVFIDKSQESLYSVVFACLSKILEIHQFLVDNLKQVYWQKVCHLILHENRYIQVQALNLLNDFTYHSQRVLDFLLANSSLFDILYKRLMIQKSTNDHFVTPCVQKIAYIICNSLLTDNLKLKKDCLNHHVWEGIFNSLHPSIKLFPLIMTMPYFFLARGHKNFDKFFRPYLETLKNFDWQQCRYKEAIYESIKETFYKASDQWQDHQYILFLNILQQQGFLFLVEDLVQQSDLEKIKDIEIQ